jgi:MFS family permease
MREVPEPVRRIRLSPIVGIFLTVFLDLLSFGMFIPDIQLRGRELSVQWLGSESDPRLGLVVGAALSAYSLAQLVFASYLGGLSDRVGRRNILVVSTVLAVVSYLLYAQTHTLAMLFAVRILMGIAAANIGVAFAYAADVTAPEDRAKGLGLVGAGMGLGFILGPPAGGLLLQIGGGSPFLLGMVGAALAALNLLYILFFLPEPPRVQSAGSRSLLGDLRRAFATPGLSLLVLMFFAVTFGFTNLETTYFQLLADSRSVFALNDQQARTAGGLILGFVGVVSALMQGVFIRRLTPRFGEVRILRFAYLLTVPGLAMVPFLPLWIPCLLGVVVLATGTGLAQPSLSSLISRCSPKDMQGGIFGVTQSLGAFARFVAPLISNPLFQFDHRAPYLLGAVIVLLPAIAAWFVKMPVDA